MDAARYPNGFERRGAQLELRATGRRLEGYAAVFGSPAVIGGFTESIRAGAFTRTLAGGHDTLALMDHGPAKLLARTSNGSLRLAEDTRGLHFSLDLPNTTLGSDALAMVESRLAGGMSFGFRVPPGGDAWPTASTRELRAVDLAEISLVSAFPAYGQTEVSARARQLGRFHAEARLRSLVLASL
jgi:HK97 family phage prohead protease